MKNCGFSLILKGLTVLLVVNVTLIPLQSPINASIGTETGLIFHLPMDEGYGDITYDQSGNGHDGTIYGARWANGVSRSALEFDGVDDYVETNSPSFSSGELTVSVWVFYEEIPGMDYTNAIVCQDDATRVFQLSTYNGYFAWHQWTNEPDLLSLNPIEINRWYHVAVTFDGSTHTLYINGDVNAQQSGSISFDTSVLINIGRMNWDWIYFHGIIDEVRIYDRSLGAEEVQNHYKEFSELSQTIMLEDFEDIVPSQSIVGTGFCRISTTNVRQGEASNELGYEFNESDGDLIEFQIMSSGVPFNLVNAKDLSIWIFGNGVDFRVYCYLLNLESSTGISSPSRISVCEIWMTEVEWLRYSFPIDNFDTVQSVDSSPFDFSSVDAIIVGLGDCEFEHEAGCLFFDALEYNTKGKTPEPEPVEIIEDFDAPVEFNYDGCTMNCYPTSCHVREGGQSNEVAYDFTKSYAEWGKFQWWYNDIKYDLSQMKEMSVWIYGSGHQIVLFCYFRNGNWDGSNFIEDGAVRWDTIINHEGWKRIGIKIHDFFLDGSSSFDYSEVITIELGIGDAPSAPCAGALFFDDFRVEFSTSDSSIKTTTTSSDRSIPTMDTPGFNIMTILVLLGLMLLIKKRE